MKKQVDWAWANSLRSLAIFEAATLSLGFELNSFAPVGQRFTNREVNEPPAEYRERVILAYEAARDDSLKVMGRTAARGEAYDPLAGFDDGQLWDVAPADFRRWCDAEGFAVPAEWVPRDYSKEVPAPTEPASEKPTATIDRGWVMKKAALIKKHEPEWRTINRDFQDASDNGLSIAAKAPGHGEWFEADALNWARQRAKLNETTGQQAPSRATPFSGLTHRIKG